VQKTSHKYISFRLEGEIKSENWDHCTIKAKKRVAKDFRILIMDFDSFLSRRHSRWCDYIITERKQELKENLPYFLSGDSGWEIKNILNKKRRVVCWVIYEDLVCEGFARQKRNLLASAGIRLENCEYKKIYLYPRTFLRFPDSWQRRGKNTKIISERSLMTMLHPLISIQCARDLEKELELCKMFYWGSVYGWNIFLLLLMSWIYSTWAHITQRIVTDKKRNSFIPLDDLN
jgi:hypothetical protein